MDQADISKMKKSLVPPNATKGIATGKEEQKLPYCPEGSHLEYTNQGPCRKRPTERKKRRKSFRVPLKKEDGNLESQVIEYNCEFPNRVVVRLEYLMQSTKVRLNDRQYMDEFYEKLLEEETRALKKATRAREKAELTRMKKLIIEGINKDIPDELSYLHRHPVFRVNQMLNRLSNFDHRLVGDIPEDQEMTPVEPYEYDGNRFFKFLHETGELWIPEEQALQNIEITRGKIYRAKLRLLQKREQQAMEEKILRILNDPNAPIIANEEDDEDDEDDSEEGSTDFIDPVYSAEKKRGLLATKIQSKSQEKVRRLEDKIRISKERELEREAALDIKRRELEKLFVETVNYDEINIISEFEKRQRRRTVEEILERDQLEASKSKRDTATAHMKHYSKVFEKKSQTLKGEEKKYEGTLLDQLRRAYNIPGDYPVRQYEEYNNELITEYLDGAEDCEDLMEFGDDVSLLYDRQKLVLEDHIKKARRKK